MQPEQPTEPNEPGPAGEGPEDSEQIAEEPEDQEQIAEEPENPEPEAKPRQDPRIHRELWEGTRLSRTVAIILVQGALWFNFFYFSQGTFTGLYVIIPSVITIIGITYVLISVIRSVSMPETALMLLFGFSSLVGNFSILYWNYGSPVNFTEYLTRLDAVYFAVGTLTTAGTGNVSAVSQLARGLQALQMALDIGFIVFAVALAVTEISGRMQRRRDQQDN
jgi:Ion channel